MNELGNLIKGLREKKGFSQRQLALYSGISNTEISKLESGERQKPNPEILKNLAQHLDTTYEELMIKAGYIDNGNINHIEIIKNDTDELEEEFPEGVKVLRRASKKLSPEARKTMIRLMKAFLEEEENKD